MSSVRPSTTRICRFWVSNRTSGTYRLVWIYGGGYTAGATSDPVYNVSYIVQESVNMNEPIIVVSINYRVASFGFIASSEVVDDGATNLGLKDQRLALRWVKENIQAFGGGKGRELQGSLCRLGAYHYLGRVCRRILSGPPNSGVWRTAIWALPGSYLREWNWFINIP